MSRRPRSRDGERGFTLVEVLVSMALLAIVGALMVVIFGVGMRAILAPGASQDRLRAASNTMTLEQLLSEDVDRATCIQVSGDWYGGCSNIQLNGSCASAAVCIGWPDLAIAGQCDATTYAFSSSSTQVSRAEWSGANSKSTITVDQVGLSVTPAFPGWPVELYIKVTSTDAQLANPPTLRLQLWPLAKQTWPNNGGSDSPC